MLNVLIADREKTERNIVKTLFKKTGAVCKFFEASDGRKAFSCCKRHPIDILITDIDLPEMDGLTLLETVEKNIDDVPKMLIVTKSKKFAHAKKAIGLGVSDYIVKPVVEEELTEALERILEERLAKLSEKEKKEDFLKNHMLYILVNGASKEAIEAEISQMEDVSFLNEFHRMVLIEFTNEFFSSQEDDFGEILEGYGYIEGEDFRILNLNPQESVLFFSKKNIDWDSFCEELQKKIKDVYNENCYIALSSELTDYMDIPRGMEEIELLMENKFYQTGQYVFLPIKKENEKNDQQPLLEDTLIKEMQQDIKMKDIVSLRMHFTYFFDAYKNKTEFSQVYTKFVFSNLLKSFYENLPDMNEQDLNQEIDKLYRAGSMQEVMEVIHLNIDRLEKLFIMNPQMSHREIETVKQHIYAHYDKELSVEQLAELVNLAPSYLSFLFKKETGENLSKYIKNYRMEKAKEMLEETHSKIVNIALAVGYPNVSYFCQSFREYFGVSPQKFRKHGEGYRKENKEEQ